jgi:hypothetical protein
MASDILQDAVVRNLEIIGETTKRLSDACRQQHPQIPWRQMAGMRDVLIHAYDRVDLEEVWITAPLLMGMMEWGHPIHPFSRQGGNQFQLTRAVSHHQGFV